MTRVLIAAAVLVVVALIATVFERRRRATARPVRDPYPIPRQLFRADFARPDEKLPADLTARLILTNVLDDESEPTTVGRMTSGLARGENSRPKADAPLA